MLTSSKSQVENSNESNEKLKGILLIYIAFSWKYRDVRGIKWTVKINDNNILHLHWFLQASARNGSSYHLQ